MKRLIDNQLPEALGRYLADQGFVCQHVRRVGLRMATDEEYVWAMRESPRYSKPFTPSYLICGNYSRRGMESSKCAEHDARRFGRRRPESSACRG